MAKSMKIYTLENPTWNNQAGTTKGIGHDRQSLGIILNPNDILEVRLATGSEPWTLWLLNDDSETEKKILVDTDWVSVSNSKTSVPFINTPYVDGKFTIEYKYPSESKVLPIYEKYNDETEFFRIWDDSNAEFALISSSFFNMLIPAVDKPTAKKLDLAHKLDGLIDHYEKIFNFYNQMAGLSFEPNRATDKNIRNKYFIKADKNGAGSAYYGVDWTAESSNSVANYWLNVNGDKWGHLHEIAHGYKGKFMNYPTFLTDEVWNNIYGATYQDTYLGEKVFKEGWLYGKSQDLYKKVTAAIADNVVVNEWDFESKLFFIMLMNDSALAGTFTRFNQKYHLLSVDKNFTSYNYRILDLLAKNYIAAGQIDATPFVLRVGGSLTKHQARRNAFFRVPVVYPLTLFVHKSTVSDVQRQLSIKTPLSLVTPSQLASSGLKGTVPVTFKIDSFQQIYGETLTLLEGKSTKYETDPANLIVREGNDKLDINYRIKKNNQLVLQSFYFLGLGDDQFATVVIDLIERTLLIDVVSRSPHSYFPNKEYAQIIVKKSTGEELFKKIMEGTDVVLSSDLIKFEPGCQLELCHTEPFRLKLYDFLINTDQGEGMTFVEKLNHFTLTEMGLQHELINLNDNLKLEMNDVANDLTTNNKRRQAAHVFAKIVASYWTLKDRK